MLGWGGKCWDGEGGECCVIMIAGVISVESERVFAVQ